MQSILRLAPALLLCLGLAACDTDIKEVLGLNHRGPDAFDVYTRPPLTIPPDFNLQAPGKGPESAAGVPTDVQAHNKILSTADVPAGSPVTAAPTVQLLNAPATGPAATAVPSVTANALPTNADAQFLSDAGVAKADPNIRNEIDREKGTPIPTKDNGYLLTTKSTSDPLVDSTAEADRLKQDKAQGQPPTTGDTPVVTPQNKGILGGIF